MPSKHPHGAKFLRKGIFDNIRSFCELEARIRLQPTTKDVGDAFEIFVEGYIATQKIMQADQIWLVGQIPLEIRKTLIFLQTQKELTASFVPFPAR